MLSAASRVRLKRNKLNGNATVTKKKKKKTEWHGYTLEADF